MHPDHWDWRAHPSPRGRFDPLSGRFRVRYGANSPLAAARERFPSRMLTEADGDLWLVVMTPMPPALHLTHQRNLDALRVDDRVSTGRIAVANRAVADPLLETCGQLADATYDWWAGRPPPLLYRTRTMPASGRSIAFFQWSPPPVLAAGRLRDAIALHVQLVLRASFTVPAAWLEPSRAR